MNLLGKATDNDFWKRVREEECFRVYRDNLHSEWDAMISGGSIRALRYSDFKLFFTTGNRSVYERTYFEKHKALTVSALLSIIYTTDRNIPIILWTFLEPRSAIA